MSNVNTPFNGDRIPPVLERLGITFATDEDGDLYADWDGMRLWLLAPGQQGEILAMRALWDYRAPVEEYARMVSILNDWNSTKFWPRASCAIRDERIVVGSDLVIDLETGASDEFLEQQVRCMVATSGEFLDYLAEAFPAHRSWQ